MVGKIFPLWKCRFSLQAAHFSSAGTSLADLSFLMIELGTMIGTLTLALIGMGGVIALLRRWAPQLRQRLQLADRLQHQGLLSLTPQCSVALVRVGQETLVLGVTPHSVTLLMKAQEISGQEEKLDESLSAERQKSVGTRDSFLAEKLEVGR